MYNYLVKKCTNCKMSNWYWALSQQHNYYFIIIFTNNYFCCFQATLLLSTAYAIPPYLRFSNLLRVEAWRSMRAVHKGVLVGCWLFLLANQKTVI